MDVAEGWTIAGFDLSGREESPGAEGQDGG